MSKQFVLYGLGGADTQYVAIRYFIIDSESFTIDYANNAASYMRMKNPSIQSIYLVDNRPRLRKEYMESIKDRKNSIESRAIFRDTLERTGFKLL